MVYNIFGGIIVNNKKIANELINVAKELVASNKKEYVIWGIPKDGHEDTLLLGTIQGKPINDKEEAKRYMKVLAEKHGCTKMRIQEIDLSGEFDWLKETGLKK
jgi:hypothetical protein